MEMSRLLAIMLISVSTSGCVLRFAPDDSNPVPLKDALAVVDRDVRDTSPARLGEVDTDEGKMRITAAIQAAQCVDGTANPLEPVITGPITIALQGSITKASGGTGTGSLAPSLAYSYTVTTGQQQQLSIPITFVPLKTVPDFYLGQNLANFNGISDSQKKPFVDALLKKRDQLQKLVDGLPPFDKSSCSNEPKKPFVPYNLQLN